MDLWPERCSERVKVTCPYCGTESQSFAACDLHMCPGCHASIPLEPSASFTAEESIALGEKLMQMVDDRRVTQPPCGAGSKLP